LSRRVCRPPEHLRHLGERHREHVVQDEGEPLGGRERVEHDQQRQADRVGEHRLVLRVAGGALPAAPGVGHRAEQPVRHRPQVRPVLLERRRQPVVCHVCLTAQVSSL
jgi:hypothetical protein